MSDTWVSQGRRLKKVRSGPGRVHLYVQRRYTSFTVWEPLCNTRMHERDVSRCHRIDCIKCIDAMETYDLVEKF